MCHHLIFSQKLDIPQHLFTLLTAFNLTHLMKAMLLRLLSRVISLAGRPADDNPSSHVWRKP